MKSEKPSSAPASGATPARPPQKLSASAYLADEAAAAQRALAAAARDLQASIPDRDAWLELARRHPVATGLVAGGVGMGVAGVVWRVLRPRPQVVTMQRAAQPGAMRRLAGRGMRNLRGLALSALAAKLAGQRADEEDVDDTTVWAGPE